MLQIALAWEVFEYLRSVIEIFILNGCRTGLVCGVVAGFEVRTSMLMARHIGESTPGQSEWLQLRPPSNAEPHHLQVDHQDSARLTALVLKEEWS